jgi:isoamylase
MRPSRDLPPRHGATVTPDGVEFAVFAGHADKVEICLFEAGDPTGASELRINLPGHTHGTWFGSVPGLRAGQRYGVRALGPWLPSEGLRYNADKLLLDPCARAIEGQVTWRPEVFGHVVDAQLRGDPDVRDLRNSAPYVPRSVVVDNRFDWGDDAPPQVPWAETVIYETHIRNFTKRHPEIPEWLRGTYAGMAHPAAIAYLQALGVTSVELLPVHAFSHEPELVQRGLQNHWGYNTLGFSAPQATYAASSDPQGGLDEFKGMVKLLHAAGLEVILDVVYNHTCEQGRAGATLSLRGLDNRVYYRLDGSGRDIDVTGCGNTLDLRHPMVALLVLDSLRYWVEQCHVDGFRFDLAVALARGRDDAYNSDHPFLVALRTDPVLSRVKLIAEPWDLGVHGWRTGQFPPPFAEWNDHFRDAVRTFWLPDVERSAQFAPGNGVRELATRLAGSQDLFGTHDRGPTASINYVAAHDGFTLADTTIYAYKDTGASVEGDHGAIDPRDPREAQEMQGDSQSSPHSEEMPGVSSPPMASRQRAIRNMLATELLATGVPMINAGDEFGRSQQGNSNAYYQDNPVSWFDWDLEPWQRDLLGTTRFLTKLRATNPVLRQWSFFTGHVSYRDGVADLQWFAADGHSMHDGTWDDPHTRTLTMLLDGSKVGGESFLIVFHGGARDAEVTLPARGPGVAYRTVWDSAWDLPLESWDTVEAGPVILTAASIRVYSLVLEN